MSTVTVSDNGQVVIPAAIRKHLGITPGSQLTFSLEGNTIRVEVKRAIAHTTIDEGFGMLVCPPGPTRHLTDFDVAKAMGVTIVKTW
ncbi:AbrB/MazE/SpoVT family DNA-binding domain-containing protein [Nodosilinea sp. P-1105]|uniref:AbrB/MazE/SpoVT family DNA-binding domain-containing protein n=1 Tax=Nodosilinea sp. P-1105 TaxID=2546229 RepID=UPI00146ED8DD|nr:AbrB/MazE/SpoVT family DNA-binding domain-containing protein [Nodosilinea sp. P-1105]NMF85404.1 AbrB/MazE/SpoVT family DNA-binding domain-containing protein [Nodosilinea sp. P-1105]